MRVIGEASSGGDLLGEDAQRQRKHGGRVERVLNDGGSTYVEVIQHEERGEVPQRGAGIAKVGVSWGARLSAPRQSKDGEQQTEQRGLTFQCSSSR